MSLVISGRATRLRLPSARESLAAAWAACLIAVSGCAGVSLRTTGADTTADLQSEDAHKATYAVQMARVKEANQLLAPTGSNPGVCNAGGSQQGCYDADVNVIGVLQAMLSVLESTPVPPRFADADALLREAITEDIGGLGLRNKALSEQDDAAWTEHKGVLDNAIALFGQAYQAFPEDNRPQPPP